MKRGPKPKQLPNSLFSNIDFWYFVGLVASDGCLSSDGRHIEITSKEKAHLVEIKNSIGFYSINVTKKKGGWGHEAHRIQIGSVTLYNFLKSLGIMPAKSLRMGSLNIPNMFFKDFLRGFIDGDGSIRKWIHPSNGKEQWSLLIYTASKSFSNWLFNSINTQLGVRGKIHVSYKGPLKTNILYVLKYGKMAARKILKSCYYPNTTCLPRKCRLASECIVSYKGWKASKTAIQTSCI